MKSDYLSELNESQRAAVEYLGGPELVIAGAGSGKTRVLTYKIVHLLANGYDPGRILALTFTNKAAREMRSRIEQLTGTNTARRLWMGTFHSIFSRILRRHCDNIGYTRNYTIYDTSDSKSLIKMLIKELDLDEKLYKASTVQNTISWAKNALVSPEAYAADRELMEADVRSRGPRLAELYRLYMIRCRLADAMDFDDLLYYTAFLLRDNPGILGHYREFFTYILVDEYQDTNFAQNMIMTMLAQPAGNICVVGDDAQSIYSFRGANISNILELERSFPTLRTFKLEQNYRSTKNIIGAANSLIAHNERQIRKEVFSLNAAGERVEVQSGHSDYDEAGLVASRIVTRRAQTGDPLSEFAILYRTNAQSRVLEEALRRRNIAYHIYGGQAFYQRKEVKDAICYFRMAVNPNDDEALKRIINTPARGIGKTTLEKLSQTAIDKGVSMWKVLTEPAAYNVPINSGTRGKLDSFASMIRKFMEANASGTDAESLARLIISHTGLLAMYMTDHAPENISRRENIEELIRGAHSFVEDRREEGAADRVTMADFLADVSLATDQDEEDPAIADSVTLMTIHAAKGLEFSNIFLVGVEEDLLPSSMSHDSAAAVEEERRLFYVALTRAKNYCMLSYVSSRYLNGQTMLCRPSRFLKDINPQYLKFSYGSERLPFEMNTARPPRPAAAATPAGKWTPLSAKNPSRPRPAANTSTDGFSLHGSDDVSEGMRILHPKFGEGTINGIDHSDVGTTALVNFDNSGERKLLLKYAKFKILD
ncbi:MAG: UvrD-helicase domain-containing protein [Muribaculaceae bacterium]|nr:UvrD-helicase domain-containing protein [Muribaculaceae bacterium]